MDAETRKRYEQLKASLSERIRQPGVPREELELLVTMRRFVSLCLAGRLTVEQVHQVNVTLDECIKSCAHNEQGG